MTDRPILYSAAMVQAQFDGRKTQTRRILKPQPDARTDTVHIDTTSWSWMGEGPASVGVGRAQWDGWRKMPFKVGDRLWARETFSGPNDQSDMRPGEWLPSEPIWYWADGNPVDGDWTRPKPGIHMPRWASRLTDIVTDVRVQRLQDISEADCIAEGPPSLTEMRGLGQPLDGVMVWDPAEPHIRKTPRNWYRELWGQINGAASWDQNPWIVAITFTVHKRNIDAIPITEKRKT